MSMLNVLNVTGSAISAQSQRLNVVASNLANADTVAGPDGSAYKARQVVFQTMLMGPREQPDLVVVVQGAHRHAGAAGNVSGAEEAGHGGVVDDVAAL